MNRKRVPTAEEIAEQLLQHLPCFTDGALPETCPPDPLNWTIAIAVVSSLGRVYPDETAFTFVIPTGRGWTRI